MSHKLHAHWRNDCQGKKDYDGPIIEISSRYWPEGGGFTEMLITSGAAAFRENADRPKIKPSATSSLLLRVANGDERFGKCLKLAIATFEAETPEQVQKQVEEWANEQFNRVVEILTAAGLSPVEIETRDEHVVLAQLLRR